MSLGPAWPIEQVPMARTTQKNHVSKNKNKDKTKHKNKQKIHSFKFHVYGCFVWMYVYTMCVPAAFRGQERVLDHLDGITNGCWRLDWCCGLDLGPLEEESSLLSHLSIRLHFKMPQ